MQKKIILKELFWGLKMNRPNSAPKQAVALGNLIEKKNLKVGAELGVFKGETTFYLMNRFPDLELYGIDLWKSVTWGDESDEGYRTYGKFPLNTYYEDVMKFSEQYHRLTILRMDTAETALLFPDNYFDFVFIDADHTYEGVKKDIEAWLPKVSKFLVGHDIHMSGVNKAVTEQFGTYNELDNFVWYVKC